MRIQSESVTVNRETAADAIGLYLRRRSWFKICKSGYSVQIYIKVGIASVTGRSIGSVDLLSVFKSMRSLPRQ